MYEVCTSTGLSASDAESHTASGRMLSASYWLTTLSTYRTAAPRSYAAWYI